MKHTIYSAMSLLAVGAFQFQAAHAATDIILSNGNEFLARCDIAQREPGHQLDFGFCFGYLRGVLDGDQMGRQAICLPARVSNGQLMDIALKFMRDRPEIRHRNPGALIMASLFTAFPCQPPTPTK